MARTWEIKSKHGPIPTPNWEIIALSTMTWLSNNTRRALNLKNDYARTARNPLSLIKKKRK